MFRLTAAIGFVGLFFLSKALPVAIWLRTEPMPWLEVYRLNSTSTWGQLVPITADLALILAWFAFVVERRRLARVSAVVALCLSFVVYVQILVRFGNPGLGYYTWVVAIGAVLGAIALQEDSRTAGPKRIKTTR